jgi:hypothetical protein
VKNALLKDVYTRISDRLGGDSAIFAVAEWLTKHTRLAGKPWSFKDHEFQLAICNEKAPHAVIQKPTQVGLTELSLRIALALCAIRQYFGLIYIFPSAQFAGEVSKTRLDPIIESSDRLTSLLVAGANGAHAKRLGSSTIYMGGAASKTQAISRPVQALIMDEKDFCNQAVLTAYHGRLRHVHEEDRIVREFSTPTVSDYGINLSLSKSSHQRYMCKCTHCGERQAPEFNDQITIPGWNMESFKFFSKDDLMNPDVKVDEAYLRCRKCGKDLLPALLDSATREWVAMFEGRTIAGYAVKPFDLMKYNSVASLVRAYGSYSDESDYWNFVQGEVHASGTNQVNIDSVKSQFILPWWDESAPYGLCYGLDVGNTYCYAMAGFRVVENGITKTKVIWRKRYYVNDGPFLAQVKEDLETLKVVRGVVDIMPDGTLSKGLRDHGPEWFHAATYVNDSKDKLVYFDLNETTGVVKVQRTKAFNTLVKEMNDGRWEFAANVDNGTVLQHFAGMKCVAQKTEDEAEMKKQWVKVGDGEDHYLHAAMYLKTALDLLDFSSGGAVTPVLPGMSGVTIGKKSAPSNDPDADIIRRAARIYGIV